MQNRIKSAVLVFAIPLLTYAFLSQGPVNAAQQPQKLDIVGFGASMSDRLGADDHPAFAVHFIGEVHGSLETCG